VTCREQRPGLAVGEALATFPVALLESMTGPEEETA
jgi:hypothetical protein